MTTLSDSVPTSSSRSSQISVASCRLLSLPSELLFAIVDQVRRADECFLKKKSELSCQELLAVTRTRLDPFQTLEEHEQWNDENWGHGLRALYSTCRKLRDTVKPYLYQTLALSLVDEHLYRVSIQFFNSPYIKTLELDSLPYGLSQENQKTCLQNLLIQLLKSDQLRQLVFTSESVLQTLSEVLPIPGDKQKPDLSPSEKRLLETMQFVSQHLARKVVAVEYHWSTIGEGFQLNRRFPNLRTFRFTARGLDDPLGQLTTFANEVAGCSKLKEFDFDPRSIRTTDPTMPQAFFSTKSDSFPWKSSGSLTKLTISKKSFGKNSYAFAAHFKSLRTLHLNIQTVTVPRSTVIRTLAKLTNLSISSPPESEMSFLIGLFNNSPLRHLSLVLDPQTKIKDCAVLHATLQHFTATLTSLSIQTQGNFLCECDHSLLNATPVTLLPRAKVDVDSDELWRDIYNAQESDTCHPEANIEGLKKEIREVLSFGNRKLEMCDKTGDDAGVCDLARWLINLRGRKFLEDNL